MRKKTVFTIIKILLAAIFIAGVIYHFPWPTHVDKTLTMTKLDAEGNELGTFDIHFTGTKLNYLFQEERYVLTVDAFDTLKSIKTHEDGRGRTGIPIRRFGKDWGIEEHFDLGLAGIDTAVSGSEIVFMSLLFTEEQDRYILTCKGSARGDWSYVGSLSGNYTTQEIAEYYQGYLPKK
ncbi:MAG: hypothetical protein IJ388_01020 [Oscillospiraceae bacterium]|nr:hypothetical protein [Oscillospiraceae bacterium]